MAPGVFKVNLKLNLVKVRVSLNLLIIPIESNLKNEGPIIKIVEDDQNNIKN